MPINSLKNKSSIIEAEIQPPRERLKTDRNMFNIPQKERDAARERTLIKAKEIRAKKGITQEALDPVGQEDSDVDNDGVPNTKSDKYLLNRRRVRSAAIKGKKTVKEGYSNWREDLIEIVGVITKEQNPTQVKEKKVDNTIKINPEINIGDRQSGQMRESIENLGGTLLEMIEIDEMDYIVESVCDELLNEGYEEDDIEEALEYALTEATVTFGHDTPTIEKKREGLLSATKRRLSGVKRSVLSKVASGADKVSNLAAYVAHRARREKPHPAHVSSTRGPKRPPSVQKRIEVAGEPRKEQPVQRVSVKDLGSKKPPVGSSQNPRTGYPGPDKPKSSTSKPPKTTIKTATVKPKPKPRPQGFGSFKPTPSGEAAYQQAKQEIENKTKKPTKKPTKTGRRNLKPKQEDQNPQKPGLPSLDDLLKKENYQLSEKAESEQQQKLFGLALSVKRGKTPRSAVSTKVLDIVDSMTEKQIRDFAKTKHKGLPKTKEEVMKEELLVRMKAKISEQAQVASELQPKTTQPERSTQNTQDAKAKAAAQKAKQTAIAIKTRELQALRSTPAGTSVPGFGG
jgi:hypothetical protein